MTATPVKAILIGFLAGLSFGILIASYLAVMYCG